MLLSFGDLLLIIFCSGSVTENFPVVLANSGHFSVPTTWPPSSLRVVDLPRGQQTLSDMNSRRGLLERTQTMEAPSQAVIWSPLPCGHLQIQPAPSSSSIFIDLGRSRTTRLPSHWLQMETTDLNGECCKTPVADCVGRFTSLSPICSLGLLCLAVHIRGSDSAKQYRS